MIIGIRRAAILTAVVLVFAGHAKAASIYIQASDTSPVVGQAIEVQIVVGVLEGEIVAAYDLDVLFDPSILAPSNLEFGGLLGDPLLLESLQGWSASLGVLNVAELSLLSDAALSSIQDGASVSLATMSFDVVGPGLSAFELGPGVLGFPDVKGRGAMVLGIDDVGGDVVVATGDGLAPIPEPSSGLAFMLGAIVAAAALRDRAPCDR